MIELSKTRDYSLSWGDEYNEMEGVISTSAIGNKNITISDAKVYSTTSGVVDDWIKLSDYEQEYRKNNLAFERVKDELFREHMGKWVAIENGKIIIADSPEELSLSKKVKHRIILKVTEKLLKQPKEIYLGGTSLRIE